MGKILIRTSLVIFWAVFILFILYFPKINPFKSNKKGITIFAWGDILDPEMVKNFEKETGIHVNLNFYASNEELVVKLKATGGEGYDLVMPSDYAVELLVRDDLLQKIDHKRLDFFANLNPLLLNHKYDPHNRYSIPFSWEIFGVGVDTDALTIPLDKISWKHVFDPKKIPGEIIMLNDPIQSVLLAGFYLYGSFSHLDKQQALAVKDLLIAQKKYVEAYVDFRADYFLITKNSALVVAASSYIWRAMAQYKNIQFAIPQEGSFISVESFSIPSKTQKLDLVYRFLNYIYQPKSIGQHFNNYALFPPTIDAFKYMNINQKIEDMIRSSPEEFGKYHFFRMPLSEKEIRDIWVAVKS